MSRRIARRGSTAWRMGDGHGLDHMISYDHLSFLQF
jgi:hypothetical protein